MECIANKNHHCATTTPLVVSLAGTQDREERNDLLCLPSSRIRPGGRAETKVQRRWAAAPSCSFYAVFRALVFNFSSRNGSPPTPRRGPKGEGNLVSAGKLQCGICRVAVLF